MHQRLALLLVTALVLGGFGLRPAGAYDASLCGWWPLDDGAGTVAVDASGLAVNGTLFGNPAWDRAGKNGGCLTFDGTDDYVFIDGKFQLPNYTIAVWFRADSPGQRDIVSAYATGVRHGILLEIGSDGRLRFLHRFPLGTGGGNNIYTPFTPNGEWRHVAATKAPAEIALYMDGQEVGRMADASVFGATDAFGIALGCLDNERALARMFLGAMDDLQIYYRALSAAEIPSTMVGLVDKALATNPSPANNATDVPRDATLSWTAGQFPATHDVYFGTTMTEVDSATRATTMGVLASQGQADATFEPPAPLVYGQTYYWRIDEVNQSPDGTIFKGGVWSFTVEPFSVPLTAANITATASSVNSAAEGPEKTIDGSGLDDEDLHGVDNATMWLSAAATSDPVWIQYEFDRLYKLHEMLVWNHNIATEAFIGFGAKDATIDYSRDGVTWTTLGTQEITRAPGAAGYAANTTIDFGGQAAQYVRITIANNWGGIVPRYGLSEVRFLVVPVVARDPVPADEATGVDPRSALSWRAGRDADKHTVYLGVEVNEVTAGTALVGTVSEPGLDPDGLLALGKTYYWRVDEVNDVEDPAAWEGDVWSFSTAAFLPVDDMESYTDDEGNRIYETWADGWGIATNGSQVGHDGAPFAETTTIRGGRQSMPLKYDNSTAAYSEATRAFDAPQDWTQFGVKGLVLWFHGDPANTAGQMYVKVNGKKVAYDGDADSLLRKPWQMWYIDLGGFTGANLQKVTELTIGVEGGQGLLFIDDIGLSPLARQLVTPTKPDAAGLVAHYPFEGNANDSLGKKNGTANGAPTYVAGKVGQAIKLDGARDYVLVQSSFDLPVYTVALWFRVDGGTGQRDLLSVYDDASNHGILLEITATEGLRFLHRAPLGATTGVDVTSDSPYTDGSWYHAAIVKSDTAVTVYIGGIPVATVTDANQFGAPLQRLLLGVLRHDSLTRYFPGAIDEVGVYSRVLSDAEIASLAGRTKPFDKP